MDNQTINKLNTEQSNPNTKGLDRKSSLEILELINEEDKKVANAISEQLDDLSLIVDCIFEKYQHGGRVIYVGAGTSGRIGVLDAVECPPTFGINPDRIIGLIAGGDNAFTEAQEGAEDSKENAVVDLLKLKLTSNDFVIGIAASGRTPYVVSALEYCMVNNIECLAIANSKDSQIGSIATHKLEVVTGPEVVTGSTRLKAGTSQKLLLNMISTTLMIKSGKVYDNYMVDLKATNKKLEKRAINIVMTITGCTQDEATYYLEKSNYNSKIAIVMFMNNVTMDVAQELLRTNKLYQIIG